MGGERVDKVSEVSLLGTGIAQIKVACRAITLDRQAGVAALGQVMQRIAMPHKVIV